MLPSELLETTWVNHSPGPGKHCLATAFGQCTNFMQSRDVLYELLGTTGIAKWNDTRGRTKVEVVAVARLAEIKLGLRSMETEPAEEKEAAHA